MDIHRYISVYVFTHTHIKAASETQVLCQGTCQTGLVWELTMKFLENFCPENIMSPDIM